VKRIKWLTDKTREIKIFIRYAINEHTPVRLLSNYAYSNRPVQNRNMVDLVTIAFNNDKVIAHQIRLVKKYFHDSYVHLIADNSSDSMIWQKIYKICQENNVSYIKLPTNPYLGLGGSDSQGAAQNWVYRHYIIPRQAAYFGFLDHDIFPVQMTGVTEILKKQRIYGDIQVRENKWYLWAGFCFFEQAFLEGKDINFLPGDGLDTGGMNWSVLYKTIDMSRLTIPKHEYGHLREGDCAQSDWYELIGDWVHTFNASGWLEVAPKMHLVDDLLNKY
jgi:hypothetical protein